MPGHVQQERLTSPQDEFSPDARGAALRAICRSRSAPTFASPIFGDAADAAVGARSRSSVRCRPTRVFRELAERPERSGSAGAGRSSVPRPRDTPCWLPLSARSRNEVERGASVRFCRVRRRATVRAAVGTCPTPSMRFASPRPSPRVRPSQECGLDQRRAQMVNFRSPSRGDSPVR
jgi:hypothetical protein